MNTLLLSLLLLSTHAHAGWQRLQGAGLSYWLYTPAGAPEALMLSLHGCSQHADDLKELGNWEAAAEAGHLLVALPDVPNGGVVLGCWNYYGRNHTETNNDNGPLIALTEALLREHHVPRAYVSGLSSGATQAMLLGCLRPDLFAGVGVSSGPALGSEMSEISEPKTTAAQVAELCVQLARGRPFAQQKASLIRGDQDFVVSPKHTDVNAEAFARVYGAARTETFDLHALSGANLEGTGALTFDALGAARVSVIVNRGLAHNWPSGKGAGSASHFVNPNSVSYPAYLAQFFREK